METKRRKMWDTKKEMTEIDGETVEGKITRKKARDKRTLAFVLSLIRHNDKSGTVSQAVESSQRDE
jgi:hypothetical protein